jgi:hypothetical protein
MCGSFPDKITHKYKLVILIETSTSIENSTPPIGEPKATATPAALAAVTISLILPLSHLSEKVFFNSKTELTLTSPEAIE